MSNIAVAIGDISRGEKMHYLRFRIFKQIGTAVGKRSLRVGEYDKLNPHKLILIASRVTGQ